MTAKAEVGGSLLARLLSCPRTVNPHAGLIPFSRIVGRMPQDINESAFLMLRTDNVDFLNPGYAPKKTQQSNLL